MNRQDKEFRLIQKGMYSRDVVTREDIDELNKIQNEKAQEFLKKYPEAVVGRINWDNKKDEEFPLLKDQMPLKRYSFNFALPESVAMIWQVIRIYNKSDFEAKVAVKFLDKINTWIANAKGIQFFWL